MKEKNKYLNSYACKVYLEWLINMEVQIIAPPPHPTHHTYNLIIIKKNTGNGIVTK
jgi:hypothetical protein